MSGELDLTPHTRNAVLASGLKREDIAARIPDGCIVIGSAESAHGPYRFRLVDTASGETRETNARGWSQVATAIDGLLGVTV